MKKTFISEDSLPIHPDALDYYFFANYLKVSDTWNIEGSQNFTPEKKSVCASCFKEAKLVYYYSESAVIGVNYDYVLFCEYCKKYTYYTQYQE